MIQPTRTNLLLLKDRLKAVLNCTTILKGRRQALIKEFLKITRPMMKSREAVSQAYAQAIDALHLSEAREGRAAVDALAAINRRSIAVEVEEGNLLGLRFRDLTMHETVARNFDERPYDMFGSSPWLDEAIEKFEEIVEEMLSLASYEGKFRRLAEELMRLTRRIRILEERVTPKLNVEIHVMTQYLAERERENYYRLKRFKGYAARQIERNKIN
ncbi:MAG: V-type ATP synthase subunit D [Desulfuromonadales bacterium]